MWAMVLARHIYTKLFNVKNKHNASTMNASRKLGDLTDTITVSVSWKWTGILLGKIPK
jgi:hypothetical protein